MPLRFDDPNVRLAASAPIITASLSGLPYQRPCRKTAFLVRPIVILSSAETGTPAAKVSSKAASSIRSPSDRNICLDAPLMRPHPEQRRTGQPQTVSERRARWPPMSCRRQTVQQGLLFVSGASPVACRFNDVTQEHRSACISTSRNVHDNDVSR